MNMESLKLGMAFSLLMRTMPILLVRLGATLAFWVVALIYLSITLGVAYLIGQAVAFLGFIVGLVAVIAVLPLYQLAYRYVFFMIKAAHIAVVAEILTNDKLPDGVGQLEWGRKRVTERFGEANVMFVVDELVEGVVRAFTRTVYNVARFLPGDTLDSAVKLLNRIIRNATNYIDEAVLARSFYNEEDGVWVNARDGIALYAMVWKPLLMNAIALMVLSYVPFIVAFIIFAAPIGLLVSFIAGGSAAGWSIIALLIFAYMIKVALGDAFAMTAMIAAYQRETQGLEPSPEITAQLDRVSDKFGEIRNRIQDESQKYTGRGASTPDEPDTPAPPTPSTEGI